MEAVSLPDLVVGDAEHSDPLIVEEPEVVEEEATRPSQPDPVLCKM